MHFLIHLKVKKPNASLITFLRHLVGGKKRNISKIEIKIIRI